MSWMFGSYVKEISEKAGQKVIYLASINVEDKNIFKLILQQATKVRYFSMTREDRCVKSMR